MSVSCDVRGPSASDPSFWNSARARMLLDPRKVNLNAGTLSPTPIPVFQAVTRLREQQASNPSDFCWRRTPPLLGAARGRLAKYLNCDASELLLLPNITFAMNVIASSLHLRAGSEVLTTDHEYGAMVLAIKRIARERGLKVREVALPYRCEDPRQIVAAVEGAIGEDTRALMISHVACTTGLVLPIKQICDAVRARGVLSIIDGAHAAGMVRVDLKSIGADFYAANCHKWLMAPAGAGFLHAARHRRSMLWPLVTSWGHEFDPAQLDADSGWGGSYWQRDFEFHGTADRCPQMVLPECFDFRDSLGGDESIFKRTLALSDYARESMARIGLPAATPRHPQLHGGALTAFDFPADDLIAIRDRLYHEFDIECPITKAAGKTFLRISTAWFNTFEEIDRLSAAVGKIKALP